MTRHSPTIFAAAAVAAMLFAAPASAHQPGAVNCYKPASQAAHAICASNRLTRVDQRMSDRFDDARSAAETRYQLQNLHRSHRDFVAKRDRCGGKRFCIWWRTKQRIRQLNRFMRHI